jgi:predicted dehydrogenase
MEAIKIGFLGAGDIADLHAVGVNSCPQAELAGVFDVDGEKAAAKAQQYGCVSYGSAAQLLADPAIDAVFVLTPLESHHEGAVLALEAGKHVLVEKPVAGNIGQIEKMKAVAEAMGKICMPVHNYLYEDSVTRTRELLDSGKLGDLVAIYVLYNIHHPERVADRYPGVVRQILTHHSYITRYFGGQPRRVMAMASTINDGSVDKENLAMALLELEGGALAHLQASFAADDHSADNWTFVIKVVGTAGATRFSHADWVQNEQAAVHSHTYSAYHYSIRNTARYFIERCLVAGESPRSTLDDAIACQRIIEAIEDSLESGNGISL